MSSKLTKQIYSMGEITVEEFVKQMDANQKRKLEMTIIHTAMLDCDFKLISKVGLPAQLCHIDQFHTRGSIGVSYPQLDELGQLGFEILEMTWPQLQGWNSLVYMIRFHITDKKYQYSVVRLSTETDMSVSIICPMLLRRDNDNSPGMLIRTII